MPLSLSCPCGARFEVEETFAGTAVACPECQQPVTAPRAAHDVRTSGLALASAVCALTLSFTGIGTALAVILGAFALASIAQNAGRLKGGGFAIFGIVWGVVFTGLFVFAAARGELFGVGEYMRERFNTTEVDRSGPLELRRPDKGFRITRPTARWGIGPAKFGGDDGQPTELTLAEPAMDAFLTVTSEHGGKSIEGMSSEIIGRFRNRSANLADPDNQRGRRAIVTVRKNERLPDTDDTEQTEILLDQKLSGVTMTYLVRIVRPIDSNKFYFLEGWAVQGRFRRAEPDLRRAMDSFHLMNPD